MAADLLISSVKQSMSAESGIPTDIKFIFKGEEDGFPIVKEIKAHKLILALASDVFKNGFYGGFADDSTIEIEDATKESFRAMIDFIYNRETDVTIYDFENLCTLYYLADKYNINVLKEETLKAIRNKEISPKNVLDVGLLADNQSTHGALVEVLYETAAESLSKKFNNELDKVVEFYTEIDSSATSASISCKSLVEIMKRVKRVKKVKEEGSSVCDNCENSPCIKGRGLTRDNFVPGSKVSRSDPSLGQLTLKLRELHDRSERFLATWLPLPSVDGPSKMSSYNFKSHRYGGGDKDNFVYDC